MYCSYTYQKLRLDEPLKRPSNRVINFLLFPAQMFAALYVPQNIL